MRLLVVFLGSWSLFSLSSCAQAESVGGGGAGAVVGVERANRGGDRFEIEPGDLLLG